jgi:hypothetical protein
MNRATVICVVGICAIILISSQSFASEQFWYDQEKQAIAVDTYANGFVTKIDIDFNSDHSASGLIAQGLWGLEEYKLTELGVQKLGYSTVWGSVTLMGWGERLGASDPVYNYSSQVTTLYNGVFTPDGFHYFTPEWDVSTGNTVIYIQPVVDSMSMPVLSEDLENFYFRVNNGVWQQLAESVVPLPEPALEPEPEAEIVDVELTMTPSVLNNNSKGQWVTAKIDMPEPYSTADLDLDSVVIAIDACIMAGDELAENVSIESKVSEAGKGGTRLIAKFDRRLLMDLLPSGESKVYVHGKLHDGSFINGITTLSLNSR